jgi:hypothetical protein
MKIKFLAAIFSLFFFAILTGCSTSSTGPGAFLASDQKYYEKLGIVSQAAPWEDGIRTSGKEGTYEWWYIDSEFTNGTKVVVVFYTKYIFDVKGPAHPTVTITINFPDRTKIIKEFSEKEGKLINAAKDRGNVNVGNNYLRYDKGKYEVHVEIDDIVFHSVMKPRLPMWRPKTGHWYFGEKQEYFFAWFVAVPTADLDSTLTIGGDVRTMKGNGYHDHNWGNIGMQEVFNHWYWSRSSFGEYTVIACDLVSEKKFGYTRLPVMMIAKNGKILDDNEAVTKIERLETVQHPGTKKFIDNRMIFTQAGDNETTYRLELVRKHDIEVANLIDTLKYSSFVKKLLKMTGANPTYARVIGDGILTVSEKDKEKVYKTEALWEQMFFGRNKDAVINDYRK